MKSNPFHPGWLATRRETLRRSLEKARLDAIIVIDRTNALYLTGFDGSNCQVLVTRDQGDHFLTDFRYIELAEKSIKGMSVHLMRQFRDPVLPDLLKSLKIRRLGFEESLSWGAHKSLTDHLHPTVLKPAGALVARLRMVKSRAEVEAIATAQTLNESMQEFALKQLGSASLTEAQLQRRMRDYLADNNAAEAFETIVASNANSSLPHARPGHHVIAEGGYLLLDSGALQGRYHSDMTRTYLVGKGQPKHHEIYSIVLDAQLAALATIKSGVPCKKVDGAARQIITKAGYGELFGHGTGHGVGLEIHEGPRLNQTSKDVLEPGMIVTVEPGIYVPGFGGVRIEDLVVVTEKGYRNLTHAEKALRSIRTKVATSSSGNKRTPKASAK